MNRKLFGVISLIIILLGVALYLNWDKLTSSPGPTQPDVVEEEVEVADITTLATNLITPWSIVLLPDGDMLVSERVGKLKRIGDSGQVYSISNVREAGEGGLLGVALHPDFASNNQIYIYYTTYQDEELSNQIDRAELVGDKLSNQQTILSGIPAALNHNGGAMEFGPDGKLYVTTGDAAQEDLAQDTKSLAGKILRLNDDGTVPDDNPFDNLVWSYGHRNPQGIVWDESGRLWSVEHGPSGTQSGRDELNLIEKGANYGWPKITGDDTQDGMRAPILQSGDSDTWAPARMVRVGNKLYFTGLRGQSLYEVDISNDNPAVKRYLTRDYGRLRAIATDGEVLFIGTSNHDSRGLPREDDDKILRVPLSLLD